MNHLAIDLAARQSQICLRRADSEILIEEKRGTSRLAEWFGKLEPCTVILETCAESDQVAAWAKQAGHRVRVVPATLSRQLGVGSRGVKTDIRDARALSLASCRIELPAVHLKSKTSRERLQLLNSRHSMVTARTQLINTVRGYLRARIVRVRSSPEHFPANVRKTLLDTPDGLPGHIDSLLRTIETLNVEIKTTTTEIESVVKQDPVCQLLMSIPGIGPITSLAFTSVLDSPGRFPSAAAVGSYLGLTPGEHSSGDRVRRTGITKAGAVSVRRYLTQASLTMRRVAKRDPNVQWSDGIAKRRGGQVATIALARKLTGIMWAMWRDQTRYQPGRPM